MMQNSVTADNIQQSETEGDVSHDDGIDQQSITSKDKPVAQYVSTVSNTANLTCDKRTTTNQMTFAQKVSRIVNTHSTLTYKAGLNHNLQQQETKHGASEAAKSQPLTKVTKKKRDKSSLITNR